LASALAGVSHAQTLSLDWWTTDGGGVFIVTGTVGQPDAGVMSRGGYTLVGGFWGVPLALPELPRLEIRCFTLVVTVSWLRPADGFVLDETATLAGSPIPWTQVAFP